MEKRKREDGFTLIELMIVIAVIGILAVVLIPKVGNVKTSAKLTGVQTNFQSVSVAVQSLTGLTESTATNSTASSNAIYTGLASYFSGTNAMINPLTNVSSNLLQIGDISYNAGATPATVGVNSQSPIAVILGDTSTYSVNSPGWLVSWAQAKNQEPAWAGMIVVDPYVDASGVVNVGIVGYDNLGNPIPNLINTLQL